MVIYPREQFYVSGRLMTAENAGVCPCQKFPIPYGDLDPNLIRGSLCSDDLTMRPKIIKIVYTFIQVN